MKNKFLIAIFLAYSIIVISTEYDSITKGCVSYFLQQINNITNKYELDNINSFTRLVVAGIRYKIHLTLKDISLKTKHKCVTDIYVVPWTNYTEIMNYTCTPKLKLVNRPETLSK